MDQPTTDQPRVISHQVAASIAAEVRHLVRSGNEALAWERLRPLHPADTGAILMALPRASRDSLLRVMGPESVAWMLRQMNPRSRRAGWRPGWALRPSPECWNR